MAILLDTEGKAMGFRRSAECMAAVLLLGTLATAESGQKARPRITVLINNTARVSESILAASESEAAAVFRVAGIKVEFAECNGQITMQNICSQVPGVDQFVVHMVATGRTSSDSVFGVAFLGENGTGKYCDVFFDRIERANQNFGSGVPALMGTVMAHELGHLLLGSQSHSSQGIMRAVWDVRSLQGIGIGRFLFTRKQAVLIKERLKESAEFQSNQSSSGN